MKIRSAQISPGVPSKPRMLSRRLPQIGGPLLFAVAVVFAAAAAPPLNRHLATPQGSQNTWNEHVKCVIGLENIKPNAKGTLSLLASGLEFATGKNKADISIASIQDIYVGQESRQDVSGPVGTVAKAGIPYGGGRIVSLFSHKVEVLTVEYADANGGYHGTIFVLSAGKASELRNQLVARGAKATTHVPPPEPKEQKP